MIYFSKESQQKIHLGFYDALKDSGYLITGKSEILSGEPYKRFVVVDNQTELPKAIQNELAFKLFSTYFTFFFA